MKTLNSLIATLLLLSFTSYAQNSDKQEDNKLVKHTDFRIETDNIEELRNYNWESVKEIFKGNNPEDKITISYTFNGNFKQNNGKVVLNNYGFTASGKTANLEALTLKLKNSLTNLDNIYAKYNGN
ncbi:hypothetical protein [Cellulophaga omnivescoria]|uniref:hypothetical protein n=1 Tax=Cellulophaga omnivescoria TaxID=1888890 RepID=UPI0022F016A8|nr:hypothetical protein [Cellulophaga omnivescoria]WBU88406.1 hypothetical protein PBN93_11040 [Cellulophaga omnivescoria]